MPNSSIKDPATGKGSKKSSSPPMEEQIEQASTPTMPSVQPSLGANSTVRRAINSPQTLSTPQIMYLQSTIGNRAVQRMLSSSTKNKNVASGVIERAGEGVATLEPPAPATIAEPQEQASEDDEENEQEIEAEINDQSGVDLSGRSSPPPPPPPLPPRPEKRVAPEKPPLPPFPRHVPTNKDGNIDHNADTAQDYTEYTVAGGGAVAGLGSAASKISALSGLGEAGKFASGFGAAGGLLGVVGAGAETVRGAEQSLDKNITAKDRRMGTVRAVGNAVGNSVQSASTAAYGISTLMGASKAAAGATAAAGAGALVYGSMEMIRGAGEFKLGRDRERNLQQLAGDGSTLAPIQEAALLAASTQNMRKNVGAATAAKGAMLVAGGVALVVAATNPIGWALLGGAALIGGIAAFVRFLAKRRRKKAIAIRVLGVEAAYKAYQDKKAAAESISRLKRTERNQQLALVAKQNPLHKAMEKAGYTQNDYPKFYSDYVTMTANALYEYGVEGKQESNWGGKGLEMSRQVQAILVGMGLEVKPEAKPPTPSRQAIASALHK